MVLTALYLYLNNYVTKHPENKVATSSTIAKLSAADATASLPETAVSEAVTNCIVHAYPERLGNITLRCRILKDNVLDIVVKDKGIGITDIEQAMRPMYTTGGSDRSGMGFTIMESFMTTFSVTSTPGKGTCVHMRRKLQRRK